MQRRTVNQGGRLDLQTPVSQSVVQFKDVRFTSKAEETRINAAQDAYPDPKLGFANLAGRVAQSARRSGFPTTWMVATPAFWAPDIANLRNCCPFHSLDERHARILDIQRYKYT